MFRHLQISEEFEHISAKFPRYLQALFVYFTKIAKYTDMYIIEKKF